MHILMSYWPRLVYGLIFALFNTMIIYQRLGKKNLWIKGLILFVISGPVVSVFTEIISKHFFSSFISAGLSEFPTDIANAIFVIYAMTLDMLSFIIPIYVYIWLAKDNYIICATTYFQYACIDRLCQILSISNVSYIVLLVLCLVLVAISFSKVGKMIVGLENPKAWRPVLHYVLGLFFVLDALYGAYTIFPGIEKGVLSVVNAWIDIIAIIFTVYLGSFLRLNLMAYEEQSQRLLYMSELKENHNDIIQKFAQISEAKSGETGQHVKRVSEYSAIIAKSYGLSDDEVDLIRTASMMHDFGKLLIPNEIVEKPGGLTDEEKEIMKKHTVYGYEILTSSVGEVMNMARTIAYEHHERYDGSGYPRGLSGDEISIYAQIVALADVYDALTSKRSYKEAWTPRDSYEEILRQKGKHFAPEVVDAFCDCYDQIEAIRIKFQ
ncbi:HD-GYP domain-containing protein [Butyrivibrio sp. AE3004]|uniref:HD-GYP domain-containing protein n=1 Tax=Butyrivibrio sp. AE3004 TaxID=1506994 RepID=UPI00068BF1A7|nr:HD domain-containing phosphohydrolase [Butyrivibrio sp. AE3004]